MTEPQTAHFGPISTHLEADLRDWIRRHGIVLWLDQGAEYTALVDRLMDPAVAADLPYEVLAFRGSHLALMLALESKAGGVERARLVIHLPGFNEDSVKSTPLLELYAAGVRYRKKLSTLVGEAAAGKVRREAIEATQQREDLTLDAADLWLTAAMDARAVGVGPKLQAMTVHQIVDGLLGRHEFVAGLVDGEGGETALWAHLDAATGLTKGWSEVCLPAGPRTPESVAFAVASWALCVEYVHDLRREPVSERLATASGLVASVVETCCGLAEHLRGAHASWYAGVADETQALLADEVKEATAADLGDIDTFRFEEVKLLEAAMKALDAGDWSAAAEWARLRLEGRSFWLTEAPNRATVWRLLRAAAALGQRIAEAGPRLGASAGLAEAVEQYVSRGAAVDRAHRHLEERRSEWLYPSLPEFEALRAALDALRRRWREWADGWAVDFAGVCAAHGYLPEAALQQRTLFDDVVRPWASKAGTTAYFVVDALRFEMGAALFEALEDTRATVVRLEARLAELPTVTEVGMNVLAPVVQPGGRLRPALNGDKVLGFSTGEYRVSSPDTRQRAMQARVGGRTCPWLSLDEVLRRDPAKLKKTVAGANLVIVHSTEIDDAGEKGVGPTVFPRVLQQLQAAWRLLQDAGVKRFVITADHGFLLLDERQRGPQGRRRKIDPKRRHVFGTAEDHDDEQRVSLVDLGYEGIEASEAGGHLSMPLTVGAFDTGKRDRRFVHGGNSLQERVIPVLTLEHRATRGGSVLTYAVAATRDQGVADLHALRGKVSVVAQGALDFGGERAVDLALRVVDAPGVRVELCQTRGDAELAPGGLRAMVDREFELFFRLRGHTDARVEVEVFHPSAEVQLEACRVVGRFAVAAAPERAPESVQEEVHEEAQQSGAEAASPEGARGWLDALPEGGVREVFAHLSAHGAVTEVEVAEMLGGPRKARRFAFKFEEHAGKAPFDARIDMVGGVKRYVRVGHGHKGAEG